MRAPEINLLFAWIWVLAGFASGLVLGLFFNRENWAKQLYSAEETRTRRNAFWKRPRQPRQSLAPEPVAA